MYCSILINYLDTVYNPRLAVYKCLVRLLFVKYHLIARLPICSTAISIASTMVRFVTNYTSSCIAHDLAIRPVGVDNVW